MSITRGSSNRRVNYSIPIQGDAASNITQLQQQTIEQTLTTQAHAQDSFEAFVLRVILPTGFASAEAGAPLSSLVPAESQNSEQITQLCQIVYMDAAYPIIRPSRAGDEVESIHRYVLDMYEQVVGTCQATNLDLPIPAPGDRIRVQYTNPSQKSGPRYTEHLLANPTPGSISFGDITMIGGSSVPPNSLEDFELEDFDEELLDDASGSIPEDYEIADPESEHWQRALTYADHYDNETFGEDAHKTRNARHLATLHPVFRTYVKAFIAKCNEEDIQIHGNDSYRTPERQREMRAHWEAQDEAYQIANPRPAANSGWHGIGMAFDFNPIYSGVTLNANPLNENGRKASWVSSGVPAIVKEFLGLFWGGDWTNPYDPIHIDASSFFLGKYGLSTGWGTAAGELYVRAGGEVNDGAFVGQANQWTLPSFEGDSE